MFAASCFALVLLVVLISLGSQYPWIYPVLAALIALGIYLAWWNRRKNKIASIGAFKQQAIALNNLAVAIESGKSGAMPSFALKAGETFLGSQDNVKMLEWVSTGSSYQGGSAGVSIRIMRGVSYRVGQSRGQLVKNPPALSTLDVGSVNYTTERVTFTGSQQTRVWEVAKMLDLNSDHNGQTVMLSVSNRQKPSGLQGIGFDQVGPAFLVRAAITMHNSGAKDAAQELRSSAAELVALAEQTCTELGLPA